MFLDKFQKSTRFPELPDQSTSIPNDKYLVKASNGDELGSNGPEIQYKIWFKTPPLKLETIKRIRSFQLFAKSRDQGFCNDRAAGNWTWFEIVILERANSETPKEKDGIQLIWKSHFNRLESKVSDWDDGEIFDADTGLLGQLEKDNVVAVRLCSRFKDWKIFAEEGYLVIDLGVKEAIPEPIQYKDIVSQVESIHEILTEVNKQTQKDPEFKFIPQLPSTLWTAGAFQISREGGLRVLSLDGGGVRGLSTLLILQAVLNKTDPGKKPCEIFDMIGGTSTGGLIAIMLGRLEMTVDECIEKYLEFMKQIFTWQEGWLNDKRKAATQAAKTAAREGLYDSSLLEGIIKRLVKEKTKEQDGEALLLNPDGACKVFVMAVYQEAANNHGPVFLRSYQNPDEPSKFPNVKIWEAARATSAAPSFFSAMKINGYLMIDGGLGANNPLGWLWTELLAVYGPNRPTNCFLSIGTGTPSSTSVSGLTGALSNMSDIATNTEITHILFRVLINAYSPSIQSKKYWRLNVAKSIEEYPSMMWVKGMPWNKEMVMHPSSNDDPGKMDNVQGLPRLVEMTREFISKQVGVIDECALALSVAA